MSNITEDKEKGNNDKNDSMMVDSNGDINNNNNDSGVYNSSKDDNIIASIILDELSSARVVDTQTYIAEVQARMWKALNRGMHFKALTNSSEEFLKRHANSKVRLVVLYADIVGSTRLSRTLPVERLAVIIQAFTQEMSLLTLNFNGLVLKYVGDAVISYFPAINNLLLACDNAVNAAIAMFEVLEQGINPILDEYDYPTLAMKVSINVGEHSVIQYGYRDDIHRDIVGYGISMAAKMHALAESSSIVISHSVYNCLHPMLQKRFKQLDLDPNVWSYIDEDNNELYKVYMYKINNK